MVFKQETVTERLKKLEEVLGKLREKAGTTLEEYREDTDIQWIIERGLELASSMIFDIGNHILAGAYQTPVGEYEKILEKLHAKRVISNSLYEELRGLGGFRNVLVHGYLSLNMELVFRHYQKALTSFPKFIAEVEQWLEERGDR